jgi:sRNA-binding protein
MAAKKTVLGAGDTEDPKISSFAERDLLDQIADVSKAGRARRARQAANAVIKRLAATWPPCFSIFEKHREPLKIGIYHDIAVAAAGAITTDELKAALRLYCGNVGYLLACREGAERIDLNGNVAGKVTAAEAAQAAGIVARRQNKSAAKPAAAKSAAAPQLAPRKLSSLANLRAAGRARREAAVS